ncbi:MAG: PAS domain-containing sensor histidine kinase [Calditrichaeota bacterium]|nr:MAG: PAS domain-containing sensor histidine kinase [Calditrichota bacterium]
MRVKRQSSPDSLFMALPAFLDIRQREYLRWIESLLEQRDHLTSRLEALTRQLEGRYAEKTSALFEFGFQNSAIPMCITLLESGRIVFMNPAFAEQTGWSLGAALGKTTLQLGLWADPGQRRQLREQVHNGLSLVYVEGQMKTRSGQILDVLLASRPFRFRDQTLLVNAVVDITAQKQVERELAREREKYRLFFEDDISGIYISTPEGKILDCNPAFLRIFGFQNKQEALQSNAEALFFDPRDRIRLLSHIKKEGKIVDTAVKLRRRDGAVLHVIANVRGEFDEAGQLKTLRGYLLDVTRRKQLEEQMLQVAKLEALGRLVGGITHDFNNVLTVIQGYTDLALTRLEDPEQAGQAIETIQHAVARARQLTGKLMSFGRQEEASPRLVSLNQQVAPFLPFVERILGETIRIQNHLAAQLDQIFIDPTQLERVLMNLMVNARDAMPEGGTISLSTRTVTITPEEVRFRVGLQPGQYVCLSVADTGIGMDENTRLQIFEPFFTTKEAGKGTGLGLSTVYGIVKQAGGHIHVYSEPGMGTTFNLYFPASQQSEATGTGREKGQPVTEPLGGTETVLVIEDDPSVSAVVVETLAHFGYRPLHTSTLSDALAVLKDKNREIQAIISDVVLPDGFGEKAILQITRHRPQVPMVLISGYPEYLARAEGLIQNGYPYLQKPFSPRELMAALRKLLDEQG